MNAGFGKVVINDKGVGSRCPLAAVRPRGAANSLGQEFCPLRAARFILV
jgi:hypothetical protein